MEVGGALRLRLEARTQRSGVGGQKRIADCEFKSQDAGSRLLDLSALILASEFHELTAEKAESALVE